ncbi:MAG: hypothetical protein CL912_04725 [Deltaproteobacteria bacterium]|nr:hypothetical protein [Deltaproteobacteria bacterium]
MEVGMQQRIDSRQQQPQLFHPASASDDETNVHGQTAEKLYGLKRGVRQLPTDAEGLHIHTYGIALSMLFASETVR